MSKRILRTLPALAALALAVSGTLHATDDAGLAAIVDQRLSGDRTGACLAVALIENDTVARAFRCADGKGDGGD